MSLFHVIPRNEIGRELEAIFKIIDENPEILDRVQCDLIGMKNAETGRTGMTAEQVFRCAILKQYRNLTYEELAFHLEDSRSFRAFAKLQMGQKPSSSTLQENVKALSETAWEATNRMFWNMQGARVSKKDEPFGWIPQRWKPTSTIRPIRVFWWMACG